MTKYSPSALRIALSYVELDCSVSSVWVEIDGARIQPLGTHTYVRGKNSPRVGHLVDVYIREDNAFCLAKVAGKSGDLYCLSPYVAEFDSFMGKYLTSGEDIYNYRSMSLNPADPLETGNESHTRLHNSRPSSVEMDSSPSDSTAVCRTTPQYATFAKALENLGFIVVPIMGDGNCLFRSISDQVYGDERYHAIVREAAVQLMILRKPEFSAFISEADGGFDAYVRRMMRQGVWGGDQEIQALTELYQRPIEVWIYSEEAGAKLGREVRPIGGVEPIRLAFITEGHYDSLHSSSWSQNLLRTPPGKYERRVLRKLRMIEEQMHRQNIEAIWGKEYETDILGRSQQVGKTVSLGADESKNPTKVLNQQSYSSLSGNVPVSCFSEVVSNTPAPRIQPPGDSTVAHFQAAISNSTPALTAESLGTRKRGYSRDSTANKQLRAEAPAKCIGLPNNEIIKSRCDKSAKGNQGAVFHNRSISIGDANGTSLPLHASAEAPETIDDEEEQLKLALAMSLESTVSGTHNYGFRNTRRDNLSGVSTPPLSTSNVLNGAKHETSDVLFGSDSEDIKRAEMESIMDAISQSMLEESKKDLEDKEVYEALKLSYLENSADPRAG